MTDTPTHRTHILQARMQQVIEWTQMLQAQRARIVEKLVRVKANSKIAREIQVNAQLERTLARISRNLKSTEEKLNKIADDLNKNRALFLELSDAEVLLERTEHVYGDNAKSEGDRGTVSEGTDGPSDHASVVHAGGETASTAPADHGDSQAVQRDAGHAGEPHRTDGSA